MPGVNYDISQYGQSSPQVPPSRVNNPSLISSARNQPIIETEIRPPAPLVVYPVNESVGRKDSLEGEFEATRQVDMRQSVPTEGARNPARQSGMTQSLQQPPIMSGNAFVPPLPSPIITPPNSPLPDLVVLPAVVPTVIPPTSAIHSN